jgi:hypothetical protein
MKHNFGEVIGERQLVTKAGKSERATIVRLGKPRKRKDGDWECPFHITGLGVNHGYGVDGIQALTTALEGIRVLLERNGLALSWLGGEIGNTGFNRLVPTSFGAKFMSRLDRIIDQEIASFVARLERAYQRKSRKANRKYQ